MWNNNLFNDRSIVDTSCKCLPTNLKDDAAFLNFNFHATSISTTDFGDYDNIYFQLHLSI